MKDSEVEIVAAGPDPFWPEGVMPTHLAPRQYRQPGRNRLE